MNDRTIIGGVIVILLAVGVLLFVTGDPTSRVPASSTASSSQVETKTASGPLLPLAQCITQSGAVFYGAFWCPHCRSQEEAFKDAAPALPYVECSTPDGNGQTFACKQKGITSYPTWIFADGSQLTGELSLQTLAEKTSCTAALPTEGTQASSTVSGNTLQ